MNFEELFAELDASWMDRIPPQGILCYVSNNTPPTTASAIVIIKSYDSSDQMFVDICEDDWDYAVPVRLAEILHLL